MDSLDGIALESSKVDDLAEALHFLLPTPMRKELCPALLSARPFLLAYDLGGIEKGVGWLSRHVFLVGSLDLFQTASKGAKVE